MAKMNEISILTEKGVLKAHVRNQIKTNDYNKLVEVLAELGYEPVKEKNAFAKARQDKDGNVVYTTLTMAVSTKHPSELAEKKSKPKAKAEIEEIEVE